MADGESRRVSYDAEYMYISNQILELTRRIRDSFRLFVQMFSALVAASVWLKTSHEAAELRGYRYALLFDVVAVAIALIVVVSVIEDLASWREFRDAQGRLSGLDAAGRPVVPPPRLAAARVELASLLFIFGAAVAYCVFNPLN